MEPRGVTYLSHDPDIILPSTLACKAHTLSVWPSREYLGSSLLPSRAQTLIIASWPPVTTNPFFLIQCHVSGENDEAVHRAGLLRSVVGESLN